MPPAKKGVETHTVEYVQDNNNSGLKAIASVAVFFTILGAAIAPAMFIKQEMSAHNAEARENFRSLTERLEEQEHWAQEHDKDGARIDSKQDENDKWLISITSLLFKKVFKDELKIPHAEPETEFGK